MPTTAMTLQFLLGFAITMFVIYVYPGTQKYLEAGDFKNYLIYTLLFALLILFLVGVFL